jgi:hypothetical protein
MDAQSNLKIITLGDYIHSIAEKEQPLQEPEINPNDYKVYPEYPVDSDYKRNPYSNV